MSEIFDLKARVSADATPFNNAMDASASSVSSALSSINAATKQFIGSGVISTFAKATETAYEFGQVMADISSISDVSTQQLSRSIKQLDNVYGSMSNVGNSIYNIISSGFDRSEDELLSIVKNVGQASKSIRADLYNTANVFTTVANAYDLSANRFKDIADLLFVTVKEGKAEGNELARTLGLVVNTASEAGLSFAEMSAVISTLSRTQTTSQAMIGFNQMLNAMIKPSKEAADTAKQFGIEFGAAALKSKGFTAIIKDMHDKLQGNVEAINKISGPIRAMRAVVSLTGKQYENFINILEKAEDQIGTGVAMEAFAKQTNTAQQSLENLKVQADKTLIGIGQDFEPLTRHLNEFVEIFLKTFGSGEGYSLGGIGRWSMYITVALKTISTMRSTLKQWSAITTNLANGVKDTSNTIGTIESKSETIISMLPKTLTKVQSIRNEMQATSNIIADIATRLTHVSDISSKIKLKRALTPDAKEVRRTAEYNLGITAGKQKYSMTAPSAQDRYNAARDRVLARHGLPAEFLTAPLMAQAINKMGLQSNPFDYKSMTASEMHKKAMAYASPKESFKFGYERVNEFALNLDKATAALTNFSTSVSNVKTKLDAAMLPADARKVAMAQLYKTEAQLSKQAKLNVDASYVNVGKNKLRDPLSGKFVSRTEAEADELYRLRAELNKTRSQVRRDAKTQTIINDESEARYNKAIQAIQNADLRKTEANMAQRKAVAESILELRKQRRDIDAEITKAATAEDEAYWRNLRIDNANRTAIAKEMLRIRRLRKQEADAIAKELNEHERMVNRLKERKAIRKESPEQLQARVEARYADRQQRLLRLKEHYESKATSYAASGQGLTPEGINAEKRAQRYADAYLRHVERRNEMMDKYTKELSYNAEVMRRFRRRFGDVTPVRDLSFLGKTIHKIGVSFKESSDSILGSGGALSKMYNGFFAVTSMLAAWETGWSIGKAIGEKLKLADWELTQWIADIIEGKMPGSTSDKEKEIEQANLEILKKTTRARADRLFNEGKLTEAEYNAIANEIRLAQATKDLTKVRNKLAGKEEPKEEPKPVKPQKQVEEENKKNREVTLEEAEKGKYKASATLGDAIEKTIKGYKIPAALQQELLKHYTGENWSADIKDFGVSKLDYDTKTKMLHQALKVREYKDNEGRPMLPAAADSQRESEYTEAFTNTALLNEIITNYFKHQASRIVPQLKQMREKDAKATYGKRLKQAKYDSTLSGFKNTIQNEFNRFTNEGVGTVDHTKHRRIRVGEYTLDQEPVGEIEDNRSAFDAKARNYADRVAEFNKRSEYVRKQQAAMKGAGMSDKHIAESLSSHTSTLDTMKASLETERKALSELARQQVELPSEFVASYKSSAAHRGEDINSESFLTGLRRRLESKAALTRISGFNETAAQEDVRVRQLGAYHDESEKTHDAIIKNREELRRDKVSAGSMTEMAAAYESIEDIRATLARLKRQNRIFGQYAEDSDLSSRTRLYYANKVKANNIKLEKVGIQLTEAFKKLGEATDKVRSGMLNAIQSFTSAENRLSISQLHDLGGKWTHGAAGRMNNNALWHSINLAARMGGMVRSRPYMVSASTPQNRGQAFRARKQAQGAISASVDAWIMSQKYAQANVGKTVTDIYTFMKQNNTIIVRNK